MGGNVNMDKIQKKYTKNPFLTLRVMFTEARMLEDYKEDPEMVRVLFTNIYHDVVKGRT